MRLLAKLVQPFLLALAMVSAAGWLTGCTVGPNYVKPTVEVPAAYKENAGWQVAQPQDATLRGNWWEMFNDPQLNAFEEQVDISNQNVALAEAQFRQARALVQQARAAYFPTVTIGASLNNSSQSASTRISNSSSGRTEPTLFAMAVNASWEIDVWGRIRRLVESSQASAQASAADLENARLSARTELAQDYFQLRTLDTQKQLLDASIVEFQRSLELDQQSIRQRRRLEGGCSASTDSAQDDPGASHRSGRAARAVRTRYRAADRQTRICGFHSGGTPSYDYSAAADSGRRAIGSP